MRHLFRNTVDVARKPVAPVDGKVLEQQPVILITGMRCLVEGLTGKDEETLLGRYPSARYRLTWGTEDVRAGDSVTYEGETFIVAALRDDTTRRTLRYKTAILT